MSVLPAPALAHECRMAVRQASQHHGAVAKRGRKPGQREVDRELHVFDNIAARE